MMYMCGPKPKARSNIKAKHQITGPCGKSETRSKFRSLTTTTIISEIWGVMLDRVNLYRRSVVAYLRYKPPLCRPTMHTGVPRRSLFKAIPGLS